MLTQDTEMRQVECEASPAKFLKRNHNEEKEDQKANLRWIISVSIVISSMIFNGTVYGYTSPALLTLQSPKQNKSTEPKPVHTLFNFDFREVLLSDNDASWVSSLSSIGFIVGGLICGVIMKYLGRKYSSIFGLGVCYVIGYSLIAFAPSKEFVYAGRLFGGLCQGFCNCLTTIYTLELCNNTRQKAICGVILSVLGNFGTLITYFLGVFLNWRELAFVLITLSVPYFVGMLFFVPETNVPKSPYLLVNIKHWIKSDKKHSSCSKSDLWNESYNAVQIDPERTGILSRLRNFFQSEKHLFIGITLMFFIQFGGYNVVSFFAASILTMDMEEVEGLPHSNVTEVFVKMDQTVDRTALWAAVGVGVAGLFGVLLGVFLVRIGVKRKRLLMASSLGVFVTFLALGVFMITQPKTISETVSLWVTTVALITHLLVFNLGYGCLGFPVAAEILPETKRAKGLSIITLFAGIFGFVNGKSYLDIKYFLGSGATFIIYGVINLIGSLFIYLCVPDL